MADRATSQQATQPGASPFLKFRDRALEYTGSESDGLGPGEDSLDEVGVVWFGPSNLTNQHHGGMWWAACLAVEEANARGGYKGRPFRLLPSWGDNPWGTGVAQLARLVYQEQPRAILGSVDGSATHLAEQVVAKARLSLVSPISTDISVNLAGVSWMFSCAPGDDQLAGLIARHLVAEHPDPQNCLVIFSATDHDSRAATGQILQALAKLNRIPRYRFDFDPAGSDLQVQIDALKKSDPEVVLVSAGPDDAARLVKALRRAGVECPVFGTAPLGRRLFLDLAGSAAEGVRFPLLFTTGCADARAHSFVERFKAQFGVEPDYAEVFTYDAANLVLWAICSTTLNRARIRRALAEASPWPGISGPIIWDGTGQNTRAVTRMGIISQGVVRILDAPANP